MLRSAQNSVLTLFFYFPPPSVCIPRGVPENASREPAKASQTSEAVSEETRAEREIPGCRPMGPSAMASSENIKSTWALSFKTGTADAPTTGISVALSKPVANFALARHFIYHC